MVLGQLCQTKIEHFHVPITLEHYVFWLYVAVDDAGPMRSPQGRAHLHGDFAGFFQAQWPLGQALSQRYAINEFHGDEMLLPGPANFIDRGDVGMRYVGNRAGLLAKTPDSDLVFEHGGGQQLDCHLAA